MNKIFRKHVTQHLSAYHHTELAADERVRVAKHLTECSKCRAAYGEIRFGARLASLLTTVKAPGSIRSERNAPRAAPARSWISGFAGAGLAIAAVLALTLMLARYVPEGPSWEVTTLRGAANIERLRPGEALETDRSSQVQVKIADIGNLVIDPNTRIRLLATSPEEHRIALDRGKLQAATLAPPRLFIVETPAATAIDLGCAYTLEVEEDGGSLLHVTLGLVALEREGRETIVPAGAFCRTRSGAGPGTPYYEDSSEPLQSALDYLDTATEGPERAERLEIAIRESRVRDALSLWHLLPRIDPTSRGLVFDRLAQLLPPPAGVTRDGIMRLDPAMIEAWQEIVSQLWQ